MNSFENSQVKVQSGGFISTLQRVKEQINIKHFVREYEKDEVRQIIEFCNIIVDILTLPPNSLITLNGEQRQVSAVQEVYQQLDERHLEIVLENFNRVPYKIKHPKTYLRAALYNSYFELESIVANETNVRMAEND